MLAPCFLAWSCQVAFQRRSDQIVEAFVFPAGRFGGGEVHGVTDSDVEGALAGFFRFDALGFALGQVVIDGVVERGL